MSAGAQDISTVLVTGGAGYVGSVLVPQLLAEGYRVRVLDLYIYGTGTLPEHPNLEQIRGDIRDQDLLRQSLPGVDAVIHLACISNDPSFELDSELSKSINFDCFEPLVRISKESGVKRFIYASTSSVYGVSESENVTEDDPLVPITDYNKYKGLCEPVLREAQSPDFTTVIIRPATVCGYSPRMRLDLSVNILTNHAVNTGKITVFGGAQMRPNLHVNDVCDLYVRLLQSPKEVIAGKTWNCGYQNQTIADLAALVKRIVEEEVPGREHVDVVTTPSDDIRSYCISSERIKNQLGFVPSRTIEDAVRGLIAAFQAGKIPDAMTDIRYYNVKQMLAIELQ